MGLEPAAPAHPPASSGDGLDPLVCGHLRALWRYLRMHGASHAEADDLCQDAFVVALQKGALRAEPAATATFLRRTGRFLFLRLRRAGRRETAVADAVDELWARDCAGDGGDRLVAAARACTGELDGRARRAVELAYGFGGAAPRSRAAMAAELGLRENGVKTLMQRLRQRLRACIERRMRS